MFERLHVMKGSLGPLCVHFKSVFERAQCHRIIMVTCAAAFLFFGRSAVLVFAHEGNWFCKYLLALATAAVIGSLEDADADAVYFLHVQFITPYIPVQLARQASYAMTSCLST